MDRFDECVSVPALLGALPGAFLRFLPKLILLLGAMFLTLRHCGPAGAEDASAQDRFNTARATLNDAREAYDVAARALHDAAERLVSYCKKNHVDKFSGDPQALPFRSQDAGVSDPDVPSVPAQALIKDGDLGALWHAADVAQARFDKAKAALQAAKEGFEAARKELVDAGGDPEAGGPDATTPRKTDPSQPGAGGGAQGGDDAIADPLFKALDDAMKNLTDQSVFDPANPQRKENPAVKAALEEIDELEKLELQLGLQIIVVIGLEQWLMHPDPEHRQAALDAVADLRAQGTDPVASQPDKVDPGLTPALRKVLEGAAKDGGRQPAAGPMTDPLYVMLNRALSTLREQGIAIGPNGERSFDPIVRGTLDGVQAIYQIALRIDFMRVLVAMRGQQDPPKDEEGRERARSEAADALAMANSLLVQARGILDADAGVGSYLPGAIDLLRARVEALRDASSAAAPSHAAATKNPRS